MMTTIHNTGQSSYDLTGEECAKIVFTKYVKEALSAYCQHRSGILNFDSVIRHYQMACSDA
jgi:hypothetical protein